MKDWIKKLFATERSRKETSSLSATEKSSLRDAFWQFMDTYPLLVQTPTLTPFWHRLAAYGVPQMALVVLFLSGGSVAYMAEHSNPGDALYTVKRNVTEKMIMRAGTFSPEQRAQLDSKLLVRRLEEAERLIAQNEWNNESEEMLRTDIDTHTRALQSYIAKAEASGNFEDALKKGETLDSLLDTHNSKLYELLVAAVAAERNTNIEEFIRHIELERGALQKMRRELLSETVQSEDDQELPTGTAEVLEELATLHKMLVDARGRNKDLMTVETYEDVGTVLDDAARMLEQARNADDPEIVIRSLQEATAALTAAASLTPI